MTLEEMYARALFGIDTEKKPSEILRALKAALSKRGHASLLPRIFREYERLNLKQTRAQKYATLTKESERTRVLIELYKKLVNSR
jgi:hypothetical protein